MLCFKKCSLSLSRRTRWGRAFPRGRRSVIFGYVGDRMGRKSTKGRASHQQQGRRSFPWTERTFLLRRLVRVEELLQGANELVLTERSNVVRLVEYHDL